MKNIITVLSLFVTTLAFGELKSNPFIFEGANARAITTSIKVPSFGTGIVKSSASGILSSSALAASEVTNDSGITGATVKDALNNVTENISANTTITVKASGGDFTTVQAALDSLKNKRINSDIAVTISVDPGLFVHTAPIVFRHPNGNRINIVGAAPVISTVTSLASQSGTAGNYSVVLNVGSSTGMSIGDYVIVRGATGTGEYRSIMGCWEILDIPSPTQITVKNTYRKAAWPTMTITGGNVHCLKTILKFNGADGLQVGGATGYIYNLAFVGNGTSYDGINISQRGLYYGVNVTYLGEPTATYSIGINGFGRYGIAQTSTAEVWIINGSISNCGSYGLYAYNHSKVAGSGIISSGNANIGVYASDGSFITAVSSFAIGNGTTGFYANSRAGINANSSEAVGNIQSGFQTNILSSIDATSSKALNNSNCGYKADSGSVIYATSSSAVGNGLAAGQYGYYALNGSTIRANTSTGSGNFAGDYRAENFGFIRVTSYTGSPTFSPAVDTIGNGGAIIKQLDATTPDYVNNSTVTGTTVKDALNTLGATSHTQNTDTYLATQVQRVINVDNTRTDSYTENGSITKPFKTIQGAINYAIAQAFPAGQDVTFKILAGQYQENIVVENTALRSLTFEGTGIVGIIPASGNAFQSTANNDNLTKLHFRNIEFTKPVVLTGANGVASFTDVWFEDCKFVGTATLTASCINNLSFHGSYIETAISLTNVAWYYGSAQNMQGTLSITGDDTLPYPSNGPSVTNMITGSYELGAVTLTKGGTTTGSIIAVGSRLNSSSGTITIPAGWTMQVYGSHVRGNVVNNGTLQLRSGFVEGTLTGTGTFTYNQQSSQMSYTPADGTKWADPDPTTVKDALDRMAAVVGAGTPIP